MVAYGDTAFGWDLSGDDPLAEIPHEVTTKRDVPKLSVAQVWAGYEFAGNMVNPAFAFDHDDAVELSLLYPDEFGWFVKLVERYKDELID